MELNIIYLFVWACWSAQMILLGQQIADSSESQIWWTQKSVQSENVEIEPFGGCPVHHSSPIFTQKLPSIFSKFLYVRLQPFLQFLDGRYPFLQRWQAEIGSITSSIVGLWPLNALPWSRKKWVDNILMYDINTRWTIYIYIYIWLNIIPSRFPMFSLLRYH